MDKSTCKPFISQIATNELCLLLKVPLPSYYSFVENVRPKLECPLKNTTYRVRNFGVTNDLAKYMRKSQKRTYYFTRITGTSNSREIVCFEFFMFAVNSRKS